MKIDGSKVLQDLDCKDIEIYPGKKATVGGVLSLMLQQYKGSAFNQDWLKLLELAKLFHKENETVVDKADFEKIKLVVKEETKFTPLVLGQLLEAFMDAEMLEKGE